MKVNRFVMLAIMVLIYSCGGGNGDYPASNDGGTSPGAASGACSVGSITLTANPTTVTTGGTSSISATVRDTGGSNCADGTSVAFSATAGTISAAATTASGVATTSFTASSTPGTVTTTATSGTVSNTVTVTVSAPDPNSIEFASATPDVIGLRGSGQTETSTIKFSVKDVNGNSVVDGTPVDFVMNGPGGGEYIGDVSEPTKASASTVNGEASIFLNSGTVAGPVVVIATITGTSLSSSSTPISIGGGIPNHAHLTIARIPVNLEGLAFVNIPSTISVYMADRFGNYNVLNGTSVSFYAEAGAIDTSSTVDASGATTVTYRTQQPDPVDVAVLDTGAVGCDGSTSSLSAALSSTEWELCLQEYVNQAKSAGYGLSVTNNPRDGWATVVVSTRGEEAFNDLDGDGVFNGPAEFDAGTQDTSQEAFIDVDDDNTRDTSPFEIYIDDNGSGSYDGVNGVWDSDKTIFKDIQMLITGAPAYISFNQSSGFSIANGGSLTIKILVADTNLNHLIGGSTITISKTGGGTLVGNTSYTFPDLFTYGPKEMSVVLDDADPTTTKNESVAVTVKVKWKGTDFESSILGEVN